MRVFRLRLLVGSPHWPRCRAVPAATLALLPLFIETGLSSFALCNRLVVTTPLERVAVVRAIKHRAGCAMAFWIKGKPGGVIFEALRPHY